MKCRPCGRNVSGPRVEVYLAGDTEKVYGDVPGADGKLGDVRVIDLHTLDRVYHRKCWLAERRHQQLQDAKNADASAQSREPADWREPVSADVEEFPPSEGNGDYRGAGAPGA